MNFKEVSPRMPTLTDLALKHNWMKYILTFNFQAVRYMVSSLLFASTYGMYQIKWVSCVLEWVIRSELTL